MAPLAMETMIAPTLRRTRSSCSASGTPTRHGGAGDADEPLPERIERDEQGESERDGDQTTRRERHAASLVRSESRRATIRARRRRR